MTRATPLHTGRRLSDVQLFPLGLYILNHDYPYPDFKDIGAGQSPILEIRIKKRIPRPPPITYSEGYKYDSIT